MKRIDNEASLPEDVVLSVRNVSKKFCKNLRRSMAYGIKDLACNLAGIKQDTTRIRKSEFWALRNVSFDVKRGESVGIIGVNGCGKTTLFRLIHGIFPPDAGELSFRGRIGALIALGAGFHPHLTGRENVYLNGAILGIARATLTERLASIEEFAEIEEFMDAPVSTYSSGMKVRLGFSVAIHMNPDILLIDEVLAVGDLSFRNKCIQLLRKLQDAKQTVLFVSHNMSQVAQVCDRTILLHKGRIIADGPSQDSVYKYHLMVQSHAKEQRARSGEAGVPHIFECGHVLFAGGCLVNAGGVETDSTVFGEEFVIRVYLDFLEIVKNACLYVLLQTSPGSPIAFARTILEGELRLGRFRVDLRCNELRLTPGFYTVGARISKEDVLQRLAQSNQIFEFEVVRARDHGPSSSNNGCFVINGTWQATRA